jgi:hypothetical protein
VAVAPALTERRLDPANVPVRAICPTIDVRTLRVVLVDDCPSSSPASNPEPLVIHDRNWGEPDAVWPRLLAGQHPVRFQSDRDGEQYGLLGPAWDVLQGGYYPIETYYTNPRGDLIQDSSSAAPPHTFFQPAGARSSLRHHRVLSPRNYVRALDDEGVRQSWQGESMRRSTFRRRKRERNLWCDAAYHFDDSGALQGRGLERIVTS